MTDQPIQKALDPEKLIADSFQSNAHETNGAFFGVGAPGLNRLLFFRQKTDLDIPPYGYGGRGGALRRVWRLVGADIIASALAVVIQRVQATPYSIEGPQRTVSQAQQMVDGAELGKGWLPFSAKWVIDYCTQDNGAFTQIIGPGKVLRRGGQVVYHPDGMPVIDPALPLTGKALSVSHMDSLMCERTGVFDTPVRYYDINGNMHLVNYSRVHFVADMPQPDERLFSYGFCALSRCISMVQYAVNWATARNESLDNMPPLNIMALQNINEEKFKEQMASYESERQAMNELVLRSLMTLVQQDPSKPIDVKLVPIRQLWESFDEQKAFQITVNIVAMAFGLDPQDLAPLNSTAMGSAEQSTVLAEKARGKGVGNILAQLEAMWRGILPTSCSFRFDFHDDDQDLKQAQIRDAKANTIRTLAEPLVQRLGPEDPNTVLTPGAPVDGLISRQEARLLLMHEIPEWAEVLDPDLLQRQEVIVDDLDPALADRQEKMYGPRVRYNSKSRRTVILDGRDKFHSKSRRALISPITPNEIAEARQRLAAIGIDVDELRPAHASA